MPYRQPASGSSSQDHMLAGIQDDLLAALTPDERAQLVWLLTRVLDHHGGASDLIRPLSGPAGAPADRRTSRPAG